MDESMPLCRNNTALARIPMSEPPPGHTPNFINPESRAWVAQTVIVLGVAFVVMFVALRIYQRGFVTRSFGWDDALCVLGSVLHIVFSSLTLAWIHLYGPRSYDIPMSAIFEQKEELRNPGMAIGSFANMLVKLSIAVLYLRIFNVVRSTRILIYCFIVASVIIYPGFVITTLAMCRVLVVGECLQITEQSNLCDRTWMWRIYGVSSYNIFADVYLVALALRVVWGVQMTRRRKIGVSLLFLLSLITVLCAVLRIVYLQPHLSWPEHWAILQQNSVSHSEVALAIVCSCIPIVWPLLRRAWAKTSKAVGSLYSNLGITKYASPRSAPTGAGPLASPPERSTKKWKAATAAAGAGAADDDKRSDASLVSLPNVSRVATLLGLRTKLRLGSGYQRGTSSFATEKSAVGGSGNISVAERSAGEDDDDEDKFAAAAAEKDAAAVSKRADV